MDSIKTIAVTGKGGAGKTVLATLLIRWLAAKYPGEILAIDADSASSLPYTLGLQVKRTVSEVRRDLLGKQQAKDELNAAPTRNVMKKILTPGPGFDLLAMGRPEEPGCFCAVNELLRFGIDSLIKDYRLAVIDGEAGPEQLNRRVIKNIDVLLVVADMSARSLETAAGIIKVARSAEHGISVRRAGLIVNRVRGDEPLSDLVGKTGLNIFGSIPEDDLLNSFDRSNRPLLELPLDSPVPLAVKTILERALSDAAARSGVYGTIAIVPYGNTL
ncbi:MAG: AAA family ATPase [Gracilibacteraceae bacterium]|jgi:CO dehydrogenase maturation factor|nr:AAA family ATPase [Gracilibacteraceae bacterium]